MGNMKSTTCRTSNTAMLRLGLLLLRLLILLLIHDDGMG